MSTIYLNGEYLPHAEAKISVDDRGFLFGDGIYEVTPAYGGAFFRMDRHMERLRRGLFELQIDFDPGEIPQVHEEMLRRNELEDEPVSIVYLQVTRGTAPRTHHFPPSGTAPTVYAYAKAFQRVADAVWAEGFGAITYPDRRWSRADIKTVQLLPNVMAQEAARKAGETDAILVRDGVALEGSHNNLFFVFGDTVRTHPTSNQILPGVTREFVIEVARGLGYEVEERATPLEELPLVDELFFTGTTTEVRPAVRVNGDPIGDGRVGPVTWAIREAFFEGIRRECGSTS